MKNIKKTERWEKQIKALNTTADGLGKPIDSKIIETVAGLNLLEITTTQSCEGHLSSGRTNYPWINIGPKKGGKAYQKLIESISIKEEGNKIYKASGLTLEVKTLYTKSRKLREAAKKSMLVEFQKVWPLLKEYYGQKPLDLDSHLILVDITPIQGCIYSQGALLQSLRTPKERKEKLMEYQQEMFGFGEFLKQKFLQSPNQ